MARWGLLALLALTAPSAGCMEAVWSFAGIEAEPPFHTVLYADGTRFAAEDARNGTDDGLDGDAWRSEVHTFRVPEGSENLTVHVAAELSLPPGAGEEPVQGVTANLTGPGDRTREVTFHASGEETWNFPERAVGVWEVEVEGRGRGEVFVTAVATTDGREL